MILNEFKSLAKAYTYKEKMILIYSSDLNPKRAEEEWIKVLTEMSNSKIQKIADFWG